MAGEKDKMRGNGQQQLTDEQLWNVRYIVAKTGAKEDDVKNAIAKVGNDQKKIEAYLRSNKKVD
jgi:t-SNARE complex subunit (syntaxin)